MKRPGPIAIHQCVSWLHTHDAIGDEVLAISSALRSHGMACANFAWRIDPAVRSKARSYAALRTTGREVLLYHSGTYDPHLEAILPRYLHRIMIFHSYTPASYFPLDSPVCRALAGAEDQLRSNKDSFDLVLCDSLYGETEIRRLGYRKTAVFPILMDLRKYRLPVSPSLVKRFKTPGTVNILSVGRIVENKRIDDVIKVFYYYRKTVNEDANLLIVGKFRMRDSYYLRLRNLARRIRLDGIHYFNDIDDRKLNTLYDIADVLLVMSDHEGFCVPVVEAMWHRLPVVAIRSTAVAETLGTGGILLNCRDYARTAEAVHMATADQNLRERITALQSGELVRFDPSLLAGRLVEHIRTVVGASGHGLPV